VWGRESSQKGGEDQGVQSGEMRVVGQEVQQVKEMRVAESPVRRKYSRVVEQEVQQVKEMRGAENPVRRK
jgi:hypothetical protein